MCADIIVDVWYTLSTHTRRSCRNELIIITELLRLTRWFCKIYKLDCLAFLNILFSYVGNNGIGYNCAYFEMQLNISRASIELYVVVFNDKQEIRIVIRGIFINIHSHRPTFRQRDFYNRIRNNILILCVHRRPVITVVMVYGENKTHVNGATTLCVFYSLWIKRWAGSFETKKSEKKNEVRQNVFVIL